jgi:hypothetical protein
VRDLIILCNKLFLRKYNPKVKNITVLRPNQAFQLYSHFADEQLGFHHAAQVSYGIK